MNDPTRLAAVDLGSNSFRLEIGHVEDGRFYRSEYLKETVRQGADLDNDRNLSPQAMQRGWDCLARFGERLAGFHAREVRAVTTQTLREARNRDEFLLKGNALLGFPIDVISGREEARLIYQGVAQALPPDAQRRLVLDIGGRSTELILGQGLEPQVMESYRVGSIMWSTRYFPGGQFTAGAFEIAEIAAKAVLDEALHLFRCDQWELAYGTAGTVGAICDVLAAAGWPAGEVSRDGLDWLLETLIKAQSAERVRLDGLRDDRRAIIGGGVSILRAVFDLLQIDHLHQASGGLRHGVLSDLMGVEPEHCDVSAKSVDRLASKFGTDALHGQRVSAVAQSLYRQLQPFALESEALSEARLHRRLEWAAQLHEIGSQISHSDHHKHGAYMLEHSDARGFSMSELQELSMLVWGQRGKLHKLALNFQNQTLMLQLLSLRLAIILCHARRDPDLKGMKLTLESRDPGRFSLTCAPGWSQAYPQSAHLLREEVRAWQKTPLTLTFSAVAH